MGSKGCTDAVSNGNGYHPTSDAGVWANTGDARANLLGDLEKYRIQVYETKGGGLPPDAIMHDVAAPIPDIVVTPLLELQVIQTLQLIKKYNLYGRIPVSVKSGGHGYFNGATCTGIMINLARMDARRVIDNVLYAGPGVAGAQTVDVLADFAITKRISDGSNTSASTAPLPDVPGQNWTPSSPPTSTPNSSTSTTSAA